MPLLATLNYKIKRSGSGMDYLFWDHGLVRYQISVHIVRYCQCFWFKIRL